MPSALDTAVAYVSGLSPLLVGRNTEKKRLVNVLACDVAKVLGECSNCSKILQFVNFFSKIPRIF